MTDQLPLGASVIAGGRVQFRVWAPAATSVEVEVYPREENVERLAMERMDGDVWSAEMAGVAGMFYRYRLNNDWGYPDPYSRSQPEGVHGPSQVIDPAAFAWTDDAWSGLDPNTLVIYECHVGTYTETGTFDALVDRLGDLRELGITALELMPVAEFPGQRNWGYDGASLFAPSGAYGGSEGLRRLVDAAHTHGLGVILDVVYNHVGSDGNYLPRYSPDYFTDRHQTPWGDAVNFDGANSRGVRDFVLDNAVMWLREYHIDGFRLDATQELHDDGNPHILAELAETVRERALPGRRPLLIAEHDLSDLRTVRAAGEAGGYGLDALWLDDFHHAVHVLLTGEREGYFEVYRGTAEEVAAVLRSGTLFQYDDALTIPPSAFVHCLQNHDQVGNRLHGERLHQLAGLERYKAAVALLLLSPYTPLIFMGDEFAASSPFLFFTDHKPELADQVVEGRRREFDWLWPDAVEMPDPQSETTFERSKLVVGEEREAPGSGVRLLYQELLRIRREEPAFASRTRERLQAIALGRDVVAMVRGEGDGQRLLAANFGAAAEVDLAAGDWPAEIAQRAWTPLLATAEERFAGPGSDLAALAIQPPGRIQLPAECAVVWQAG